LEGPFGQAWANPVGSRVPVTDHCRNNERFMSWSHAHAGGPFAARGALVIQPVGSTYKVSPLFVFSTTSANLSGGSINFKIPRNIHPLITCHTIAIGIEIHQENTPKNGNTIAAIHVSKVSHAAHCWISRSIGIGLQWLRT
jgi:hypothetical protein